MVEALNFPPLRTEEHPDYLFWSRTCTEEINVNKWLRKVGRPDDYLSFKDEADELMKHLSYVDLWPHGSRAAPMREVYNFAHVDILELVRRGLRFLKLRALKSQNG